MSQVFEMPAEVNIYSALETRDALLAWSQEQINQGAECLEVSAKDVSEIDGSGLQLLAALDNTQYSWRLLEASEVFTEACRTMGFTRLLDTRHTMTKTGKAATP